MFAAICCTSCNNEWEDEQYESLVSFKAEPNSLGVTPIYVRYKSEGKVTYQLPLIMSSSKMNDKDWNINIGLDLDTLALVNREAFGHRNELYFKPLDTEHYEMGETVKIPAGSYTSTIPINFQLTGLDQTYKWLLPLKILENPSYKINYNKYYQRAMLQINPFNDYSGTYSATLYKIFLLPDDKTSLTLTDVKTYVVDEKTIFFYAGLRTENFLDRKLYKIYAKFTDEAIDIRKKKLELYADNPQINLTVKGQPYYTVDESMDPVKTYLKLIDINLGDLVYTFDDYTTIPGTSIRYSVDGMLSMQRRLNTLIPDEDQQIQW